MMIRSIRARLNHEGGGILMVVLLLCIILVGFVSLMSIGMVTTLKSSSINRDAAYFDAAANAAISDAVRVANDPMTGEKLTNHIGESKAVVSTLPGESDLKWKWFLRPVANTVANSTFDIVATGYRGDTPNPTTSRTLIARLESMNTSGARWVGDVVSYRPTKSSVFTWGIFGGTALSAQSDSAILSYDSASKEFGTLTAAGSNGSLNFGTGANVPNVLATGSHPGHALFERCVGDSCAQASELKYGVDLSVVSEWVDDKCTPATAKNVSGNKITLSTSSVNCFNNISLSGGQVTIDYGAGSKPSTGRPVSVYVLGDLEVAPGTKFNNGDTIYSSPVVVHFFVAGDKVDIGGGEGSGRADFRALIAASDASCNIGSAATAAHFYGAMVCGGSVTVNRESKAYWDNQTRHLTVAPGTNEGSVLIWDVVRVLNP